MIYKNWQASICLNNKNFPKERHWSKCGSLSWISSKIKSADKYQEMTIGQIPLKNCIKSRKWELTEVLSMLNFNKDINITVLENGENQNRV